MRLFFGCVVAMVTMVSVHLVTCDENIEWRHNGTVHIWPGMPIEDFRTHVVDYLLEETIWIHPINTTHKFWWGARLLVREISTNVYNIRITGDEAQDGGGVVCRNFSDTFYALNESSAMFLNEAGSLIVFTAGEPRRGVLLFHCENWEPGSDECPVENTYQSLFRHDDDDVEYYEYDEEEEKANNNNDRSDERSWVKDIVSEVKQSKDRMLRRIYKAKDEACMYN